MYQSSSRRNAGGFSTDAATTLRRLNFGPVQVVSVKARAETDQPHAGYVDPGDALVWAFVSQGSIRTERQRSIIVSSAGDMSMSHMPKVSSIQMTPDFRAVSLRIDRAALGLTMAEIDEISDTVFSIKEGMPLVLGSMAYQVLKLESPLGPSSGAAFASAVVGLTTAFVDDFLGRRSAPEATRSGLVDRARHHIELYSSTPSVTARSVAEAMGVSGRTLQKAFQARGATVAESILECRLLRARAMLEHEAARHLSIDGICLRAGFASPSSFSRSFKARFGVSPRGWRQAAHLAIDLERTGN